MKKLAILLLFLFTNTFAQSQNDTVVFDLDSSKGVVAYRCKYQIGDDSLWAETDYNDSSWQVIDRGFNPQDINQIWWYRKTVYINGNRDEFDFLSLYVRNPATAYQLYWDGSLIYKNGHVARNQTDEIAGAINKLIKLKPAWTTPGKHLIAMRLSNQHRVASPYRFYIYFQYLRKFRESQNRTLAIHLIDIGMFFLAALFSLALFLGGGRHRAYLIFAIFSLFNMFFSIVNFSEYFFDISVRYIDFFYRYYDLSTPLAMLTLNLFFIFNFNTPKKIFHISINVLLTLIFIFFFRFSTASLLPIYSIGIAGYAIKRKEPGSIIALSGITIYTIFLSLYFYQNIYYSFIWSEIFFIFTIMISISRQIRAENKKYEQSMIRSARLETELLKKNIQPHFLMNTLLSIMSWIEIDPKKAVKLIQSLADEFRMINKISSKKEIPIHQEIKLCENHLKLMGYRMDAEYRLIKENICDDEMVPPMIFHTLIENGLTHAFQTGENGEFKLNCERNGNEVHYQMQNNGSLLRNSPQTTQDKIYEGMGIKYVKARLEESYPGRWRLSYGLNGDNWQTHICIKK